MHNKSIAELSQALANGDFSSEELTRAYLDRIEALRNDSAKQKADVSIEPKKGQVIGIHNNNAPL